MSTLRRFLFRLLNVVRGGAAERELAREIASHLTLLEERFREQGLSRAEARAAARRAFGGVEQAKELQRDARSFPWLEDARRDVAYGVRTLRRTPGFTAAAILTLALGIGAVTIIYSVINNVLFDPLPYPDSDRLVNVFVRDTATRGVRGVFSPSEFLDFQGAAAIEDAVGTRGVSMMLQRRDRAESVRGVWVTPNFFEFMGMPALVGRIPGPQDALPGAPPVAVLRHRAWVSYFGADPGAVGTTVVLNGEPRTIIGVMPPRFTWHAADLWIPRAVQRSDGDTPAHARNLQARLKPGVSLHEATAQLNSVAVRRARERPDEYPDKFEVQVVNVIEYTVGAFSGVLYTTLVAVVLLLLIACCNVANMLLARATVREREMTVRAAIGASRGRIVRQLLVESLLLGVTGGALGCLLAYVGLEQLIAFLPQGPLPGEVEIALDGAALAVCLLTAVASSLIFGLAPALYSARRDLVAALKGGGKGVAGGRAPLRHALVAAEIALSLVLLLGAGVLLRTFTALMRVDLGFDPSRVLIVPLALAPGAYTNPADKHAFYEQVMERLAALPDVVAASASTSLPPSDGPPRGELEIPGNARAERARAVVTSCTPDYFRTLDIRLLRGRDLARLRPGDVPTTAVVNQTFASAYFKDVDPIGRHFRIISSAQDARWLEIVGVVEDVRNQGIREATAPQVYLPGATVGRTLPGVLVRSRTHPLRVVDTVREEIARIDPQVAVPPPVTLEQTMERWIYAQPRFSAIVLAIFALTGTVLVAVGVFSVLAYTVSQQTKEIAVRVALGGERRHILGMVLRLGARLLVAGTLLGLAASVATNKLIANQLWNTSPHDPWTMAAATAVVTIVALAACYLPARRALAVNPIAALRVD